MPRPVDYNTILAKAKVWNVLSAEMPPSLRVLGIPRAGESLTAMREANYIIINQLLQALGTVVLRAIVGKLYPTRSVGAVGQKISQKRTKNEKKA